MAGIRDLLANPAGGQVAQGFALANEKSADNVDPAVAAAGGIGAAGAGKAVGDAGRKIKKAAGDFMQGVRGEAAAPGVVPPPEPTATPAQPGPVKAGPPDPFGGEYGGAPDPYAEYRAAPSPNGADAAGPKPYVGTPDPVQTRFPNGARTGATTPGQVINGQTMTGESPLRPSFQDPLADSNARIRAVNNPHLATDAGQQAVGRANDYFKGPPQGGAGGQPPVEPPAGAVGEAAEAGGAAAKAGLVSRGLRYAGRVAAPLTFAAGVPDQLHNGATSMDDQIALELGSPSEGAAGSAYRGVAGNAVSLARRTGNALTDFSWLPGAGENQRFQGGDKVVGGLRDLFKGQPIGTTTFDANPSAPATTAKAQVATAAAAPQNKPVVIPTLRGANVTPEQMMNGVDSQGRPHSPQAGFGAFQRTTPGNRGEATALGDGSQDSYELSPEQRAYQYASQANMGPSETDKALAGRGAGATGLRGLASNVRANAPQVADQAGQVADRNYSIKTGANRLAQARLYYDMGKDQRDFAAQRSDKAFEHGVQANTVKDNNEKRLDKVIDEFANANSSATSDTRPASVGGRAREDYVKQEAAQHKEDVRYTASAHGIDVGSMRDSQLQTLLQASRIKQKYIASQGDAGQIIRGYFGGSVKDSRDLTSYIPDSVEPSSLLGAGGWVVHLPNGGKMDIKEATGGNFKIFGQNKAIDADMMQLIRPLIAKYESSHKGGK